MALAFSRVSPGGSAEGTTNMKVLYIVDKGTELPRLFPSALSTENQQTNTSVDLQAYGHMF